MGKRRNKKFEPFVLEDITLEKFVNGGQALGYFKDGLKLKPVFAWGCLPGEKVDVLVTKSRKGVLEGIAQDIKLKAENRVQPKNEEEYLSTSPWQVLDFKFENETKLNLLKQTFKHEVGIDLGDLEMFSGLEEYGYRNKMEYNFWGDDSGIHLALHKRGSGQKIKLQRSVLASDTINQAGEDLITKLNKLNILAGDLKSLVLRSNQKSEVVAALFVKKEDFAEFELPKSLKGLVCYYSNPKSPASVITKELWVLGDIKLSDQILENEIWYDVNSFFQLNVPVFEEALKDVKRELKSGLKIVDFYGGVGSIGISVAGENSLEIIELDEHSAKMAKENILNLNLVEARVSHESAEGSLEKTVHNSVLIVDPPRAGLHKKVVQKITEFRPQQLIYLSCNPVTPSNVTGPTFLETARASKALTPRRSSFTGPK
jgi:23S rRNA (uracil1939-C5)-methyltransferase